MAKRFKYISPQKYYAQGSKESAVIGCVSLGIFALSSLIAAVLGGSAGAYVGAGGLLAMLFAVYGFWLGMRSFRDRDKNYRYSVIGAILNGVLAACFLGVFLWGI